VARNGRKKRCRKRRGSSKTLTANPLTDGVTVALIKDLKLSGGSQVLKQGTKVRNIRLVEGDHEIACKIGGSSMALKACFVKKA